ncbi:MAG: hypothetical protein HY454_02175 [Parcubacteria group bacterium]|nr:hypothetical protein [Parcubacteria group bacterium]
MDKFLAWVLMLATAVGAGYVLVADFKNSRALSHNTYANVGWSAVAFNQKPYNDDVIIENRVYIKEVNLAWPGFVAVYENPGDPFGTLVGTSRFRKAGRHADVAVDLVKQYKGGERLYVMLHRDSGDEIFNLVQDHPVRLEKGGEVAASFVILPRRAP